MRRSPPNTCSSGISAASRRIARSKPRSPTICAASRASHGGWPLFHDGDLDMSASVKAYFALKMIGDLPDAPHMRRAREAILQRGGAARANVFTRALLALYGEVPWRAVPTMPVEIMLLPSWFPFHLDKVSYWARTVMVPLFVLQALKPKAVNARGVHIPELFVTPPEKVRRWPKGAASESAVVADLRRDRRCAEARRAVLPALHPQARHRQGARFRRRAAERQGRARRDLPGDGQLRADVRRARRRPPTIRARRSRASRSRACSW